MKNEAAESSPTASKQLILPPITVRWARHQVADNKGETIQGSRYTRAAGDQRYGDRSGRDPASSLPAVFVTQGRF